MEVQQKRQEIRLGSGEVVNKKQYKTYLFVSGNRELHSIITIYSMQPSHAEREMCACKIEKEEERE